MFAMFGIGPIELLVVAAIALVLIGVPIAIIVVLVIALNRSNRPRE